MGEGTYEVERGDEEGERNGQETETIKRATDRKRWRGKWWKRGGGQESGRGRGREKE